jgi:hypothetical protein
VERYKEIIREKDASLGELQATVLSKEREVIVMMHKVHHIIPHYSSTTGIQAPVLNRTARSMQCSPYAVLAEIDSQLQECILHTSVQVVLQNWRFMVCTSCKACKVVASVDAQQ